MKEYDAVIVANSPGGWVAAIILSQKGRKVLIIDRVRPHFGEIVPRGGIFFQMWPELARKLPETRNLFQVIAPGHRFSIPPGYHRFLGELGYEFPCEQTSLTENIERVRNSGQILSEYMINRFFDQGRTRLHIGKGKIFEAISLWSRFQKIKTLSVDGLDSKFSESPLLRAVFEIPNWFASNLVWEAKNSGMGSFAAYQRYAFFPLSPLSKPVPGIVEMDLVFTALRAKADEMDLEIIHQERENDMGSNVGVPPEQPGMFFFRPGRNVRRGIGDHRMKLQEDDEPVLFRGLLWTGEILTFIHTVREYFQKDRGFRRISQMAESLVADHLLDTTVVRVRPDAVPEGMEQRVFVIGEASRSLSHENILFIRVVSPYAPVFGNDVLQKHDEKEQCVHVYVSYLRPVSRKVELAAENVWQKLNWLMPFLHEFIVEGPEVCPGGDFGNDGTVIWRKTHENTEMSGFTMPLGRSGVFYSGRELFPALGGEADLLSGLVAAWKMENWLERVG